MIEGIVFDLTGVLYEFRGPDCVHELSKGIVTKAQFGQFWSDTRVAIEFTRGAIDKYEFAEGAISFFNLECTENEFISNYQEWFIGPYDGALELIKTLKNTFTIACLSNTNEMDVSRYREQERLPVLFDYCAFSNEIGFVKPETDAYTYVSKSLGIDPGKLLFLDDTKECVTGAQKAGYHAEEAYKPEGIIKALKKYQIFI